MDFYVTYAGISHTVILVLASFKGMNSFFKQFKQDMLGWLADPAQQIQVDLWGS